MATVTGLTAVRMLAIEAASIVSGIVTGDNLILTRHDGTQLNAGNVRGPKGDKGDTGAAGVQPPTGCTLPFAGPLPPAGWLLCQGQEISRTEYSALFDAIGTTWGEGDGSTTFLIPNVQDLVPVGASLARPLGSVGGSNEIVLSEANLPPHSHTINHDHPNASVPMQHSDDVPTSGGGTRIIRIAGQGAGGSGGTSAPFAVNIPTFSGSSGFGAGGSTPINHENPYAAFNYIIKT